MLSTSRNFLFIHVPKTGGNSIQSILVKYSDDVLTQNEVEDGVERFGVQLEGYPTLTKHSSIGEYHRVLDPDAFRDLFKFAVVRNPWDRMISYYFSPYRGSRQWNRQRFIEMVQSTPPWRTTVQIPTWWRRLKRLVGRPEAVDSDLDFVIRFEQIEADFHAVCRRLHIAAEPLPVRNRSERTAYAEYYDDELRDLVEARFSEEIERFGYRFDA